MKRQIIKIDENRCNGCGLCASACAEGAIQMVDGKARLVSEIFCDGLGACLGECPVGAISIEKREAEPYDERKTMDKLLPQGLEVVRLHLEHLENHGQRKLYEEGCAYLAEKGIMIPERQSGEPVVPSATPPGSLFSMLPLVLAPPPRSGAAISGQKERNWPIQLHLINPASPVFDDADLVVAADCTAFSTPDFYERYVRDRVLIIFCPKLDRSTDYYVEKLAAIFSDHAIRSVTVLRMQVPCCGGTSLIVRKALEQSGKDIPLTESIVPMDGILPHTNKS